MDPFNVLVERAYPTPYSTSPLLPLLLMSLATQKHTPTTKTTTRREYDFIVVGSGAAGSTVAGRLSELPCVSVLVLEAGPSPPRLTEIPAIARNFWNTNLDWQFKTEPQRHTAAGINGREMPWPSGKAVGGSSILNAMLYVRGNRRNYDEWAELGAEGWSYEDVKPYFLKLENNTDPEYLLSSFHAAGGPMTVSRPAYNPEKKLAEIEAIEDEQFEFVDPNDEEQIGFFDYQATIRNGQRCSTAKGYLVPAENRNNLDILPNAQVTKIILEDKRAVGVEFVYRGKKRIVRARKEVILSAGTTNSAQLLMLSGIGPMSELMRHNILTIADLPVGFNFQDHPAAILSYEVDSRLPTFDQELQNNTNILDYIDNRNGPLTSAEGVHLMSFLSNPNPPDENIPNYSVYFADFEGILPTQIGLTPLVLLRTVVPLVGKSVITCASQHLKSHSTGTVGLKSANPFEQPRIDPNYLSDFRDVKDLIEGMKTCQQIMQNPAMKRIGAKPANVVVPGCEDYLQDEDLYFRCIVRTVLATTSHPVGTCRMGDPNDPRTVVDPELRVLGIERLRVVDASVMPTIPWSNTYIPTIMVAEKGSDIIKSSIGNCDG